MEDRFKFRVWNKVHKKMYPSTKDVNLAISLETMLEEKHLVVMQCTGLKDNNGELIYEGDIVKIKCVSPWGEELEAVGYVYYDRCAYWINFKNHSSELYCEDATYEVLGNIGENPELLESNNND